MYHPFATAQHLMPTTQRVSILAARWWFSLSALQLSTLSVARNNFERHLDWVPSAPSLHPSSAPPICCSSFHRSETCLAARDFGTLLPMGIIACPSTRGIGSCPARRKRHCDRDSGSKLSSQLFRVWVLDETDDSDELSHANITLLRDPKNKDPRIPIIMNFCRVGYITSDQWAEVLSIPEKARHETEKFMQIADAKDRNDSEAARKPR
ncbi:hypothetical protein CY34DRAFT_110210 [Suillus luteus UH-Slu-Lm8-n1]|uniref:Unplaced genomic scaffold CY34scaffold_595, whole genome shotgun sequence n=1 Tax=Suillus luteus UH-Slu-Lm8-n1 TaxID=930992 RepID=A0A0D0AK28_9AGAM|nr:hypothetical protein CY34DRAFT_110210 [Suillus luteus UH-Slu-Lm8-n1]